MTIPFGLHLFIHFSLALAAGYFLGKHFKHLWAGILTGLAGGFFIDLDHALEYLIVFQGKFNIIHFFEGRQFLLTEKNHLWFHAWEYLPLLLLLAFVFRKKPIIKTILVTLAISGTIHLASDVVINKMPVSFYSLSHRISHNFEMKSLMPPEMYQANIELKKELGL